MPVPQVAKEVLDANSVTTIINNLNALYSGAMSQVITYTAIIIALVGVVIPALSILFQWRSLKSERKSLEKEIQEGFNNSILSIRSELIKEMKEQIAKEEQALKLEMEQRFLKQDKAIKCAAANGFFVQGKINIGDKHYPTALKSYVTAALGMFRGDDELNGQTAIEMITNTCLPNINKKQYEDANIEEALEGLINFLRDKEVNVNERYTNKINKLKSEMKKAKAREPAATKPA